jgi:hypothetical protein
VAADVAVLLAAVPGARFSSPSSAPSAPVLASPLPGSSGFDPAALSMALSGSQCPTALTAGAPAALPFSPAPLSAPSLTSNLPPAGLPGSSQPGWTSEAMADQVFARLDAGLSLTVLVDDLPLAGGSFEDLTAANLQG